MKAKRLLLIALSAVIATALCACSSAKTTAKATTANGSTNANDTTVACDKDYTIRIYSNSNSTERTTWLIAAAKEAGFKISIDDNSVISGDDKAVQAANEKKDGDILFGLNETRWSQVLNGEYENVSIMDWTPTWADQVGTYKLGENKAYGLVIQNVLMLYRTDDKGTNGATLSFDHWADLVDCGYTWYRQNKVGGTTNTNINSALLYAYVDPTSAAGGISVDGWKMLWKYCNNGKFSADSDWKYGFTPLNRGEVQVSTFYSSSLYGQINSAAQTSTCPITNDPKNWALVDIKDGTYYIAEYIGVLANSNRTEAQTNQVKAFAEWFGSAEVQAEWGEEFDSYPCNQAAANAMYPDGLPEIYTIKNFALNSVEGTDMQYFQYVAAHLTEWTNIQTNLGFFWNDASNAPTEPDWANLDWSVLTQKAE